MNKITENIISVIIPTYNRAHIIKRAVDSVILQSFKEWELIIVDDCSTDNTEEVLKSYITDPRIQYIKLNKNGNGNICRNIGIKTARGEYIAMLDSDDEWLSDHLKRKLSFIKETNADGVFGSVNINNGEKLTKKVSRTFTTGEKMVNYLLGGGFAQTSTHFYKSEAIKDVLWDESLARHQDFDLCVQFAEKYNFVPDPVVTATVHWEQTDNKKVHYPSQIKFIERYKADILPELYNKYHIIMYLKAKKAKASPEIVSHYKKQSLKYLKGINLTDFMTFKQADNILSKILARAEFYIIKSINILFSNN